MQFALPSKTTPLSRKTWNELLARGIRAPEAEPRVRRCSRRYAAALGSAWRVSFRKGTKVIELRGKLLNASAEGVMILCRTEVPMRVPVLVTFTSVTEDECALGGEVRHSTSTVGGYKIGVRLSFLAGSAAPFQAPSWP